MIFYERICILISLAVCVVNVNGAFFDEDYFYGSSLRSLRSQQCSDARGILCRMTCPDNYICKRDKCMCVDSAYGKNHGKKVGRMGNKQKRHDLDGNGFIDLTRIHGSNREENYSSKPVLRHHIAHFCPNLDEARTCIRTCMKEGKPAFCGKDHVCYCGHRYRENTNDEKLDPKAMYAQFKDLYKKYFGDNFHFEDFYSGEAET